MVNRQALLREAWLTGNLEYLVKDYQLDLYYDLWAAIKDPLQLKHIVNIARRFGKTHVSTIVAVEYAIRFPRAQINYAAPTNGEMEKILGAIMPDILQDCPPDLLPERKNKEWHFKNGSKIYTAGVNNKHADNLRGTSSHLNIVDEAGMIDDLSYLVKSVLMPQQLTVNGTMLVLSTPPPTADHDYVEMYHEALEEGDVTQFTILDNQDAMSNPAKYAAYVKEAGGEDSTTWMREYLCKFVTDTNKIIMPEWGDWKAKNTVIPEKNKKYQFWHKYVSMDLGFRDNTCLLFGYYDFERAKMVIQRDAVLNDVNVTNANIANTTKRIEAELWGDQAPKRIADNNNPMVLNDIHVVHDIIFNPTSKDTLIAMVNKTRAFIGDGKLEIYPECEYLLGCLEFGVWNKNRDAFASSKKYGHYDGLAALIYLLRYVDEFTNPVPSSWGLRQDDVMFMPDDISISSSAQGLRDFANAGRKHGRHLTHGAR